MPDNASDPQFVRHCPVMHQGDPGTDERYSTMPARLQNRDRLDAILAEKIAKEPVDVWLERLGSAGISVGRVNDVRAALEMPVAKERGLFVEPGPLGWSGGMPQLRLPVDADGSGVRRAPPKLGEHSAEVLGEIGYDATSIRRLVGKK